MWEIIPSQEITVGTSRERLQMRFIIFVIDGPGNPANPNEMADIDAFNEKLQSNGHWITAAGIRDTKSAKVIDNRSGKNEVTEGSRYFLAPSITADFGSSKLLLLTRLSN